MQEQLPAISPATPSDFSVAAMFLGADSVVQSVMLLLLFASVASWTILLVKNLQLRGARRRQQDLKALLHNANLLQPALAETGSLPGPETQLVAAARREYEWSERAQTSSGGVKERLAQRLATLEAELVAAAGRGVGTLASIGSTAPFIGLFGTVWGIMNSFIGIAATKSTNLAVVAPGIAEALLATGAGLLAAIPAVLFYNHFSRALGHHRRQLAEISSALMILVSRQLDLLPPHRSLSQTASNPTPPARRLSISGEHRADGEERFHRDQSIGKTPPANREHLPGRDPESNREEHGHGNVAATGIG